MTAALDRSMTLAGYRVALCAGRRPARRLSPSSEGAGRGVRLSQGYQPRDGGKWYADEAARAVGGR